MKQIIEVTPYLLLIIWFFFSIFYIIKAKKNPNSINPYIFDTIPQVFPTIGILGTFLGIAYGLFYFDTLNMAKSIPVLLDGLKTAFIASIFGIIGLLIFSKLTAFVQNSIDKGKISTNDEVEALNILIETTIKSSKENSENFKTLNNSIIGDADDSLSTQFAKMKNQMTEQTDKLNKIQIALGGDNDTSLLTQFQKMRSEQNEYSKDIASNIANIVDTMNVNNKKIEQKFEEFTQLLTENNTKALVEAMEKVITDFNTQMNELIQRLVKENFEELNNSVKNLNEWQKSNKEQIKTLINQFDEVTKNLETSSVNIKEISANTKLLTDNNSILRGIIHELQSVLVEDRKFSEVINKLQLASVNIESSSLQLSEYMKEEKGFQKSINGLIDKLKEIENIKDINNVFWKDIKAKMEEGVSIIEVSNRKLASDVEKLDKEFEDRLSTSFISLDKILQGIITDVHKNVIKAIEEFKN